MTPLEACRMAIDKACTKDLGGQAQQEMWAVLSLTYALLAVRDTMYELAAR